MRRRQATLTTRWISAARAKDGQRADDALAPQHAAAASWGALLLAVASGVVLWWAARVERLNAAYGRPRLHIYAAPKPFVGQDGESQRRALASWLALRPRPRVTLLGEDSLLAATRRHTGVEVRPVDSTFLGVPLFSAVLAAANATPPGDADVVVLLNADIVLFDDFPAALGKLRARFGRRPWVALGGRRDVGWLPVRPPFHALRRARALAERVRRTGKLHTYGGIDAWAWPAGRLPPVGGGAVPPFVLGRGRYDNWFTDALVRAAAGSGLRVVDVSEVATLAHVHHDHRLVRTAGIAEATRADKVLPYWMADPRVRYELYLNAHLAAAAGYVPQTGTLLHAPLKLSACAESVRASACLFRRRRPHACRCEHAPFVWGAMSDPYVVQGSRIILCGLRSVDLVEGRTPTEVARRWAVSGRSFPGRRPVFGLPLTRRDLLAVVRARIADAAVVLVVAGEGEEALTAQTLCAARRHGAFQRVVVAALDDELYRHGALHGWPVYLADAPAASGVALRARRTLAVVRTLLGAGFSVASVAPGVAMQVNLTRHLGHTLELGTDVALCTRGRDATTDVMFVRGTLRSAHLLDAALNRTDERPEAVFERAACGTQAPGARTPLCRNRHIRMQFLGTDHCAHVGRGKGLFDAGDAAFVLPDSRENTLMRWELLRSRGLQLYDEQTKLCRWP